jgi:hypothetical protein
MVQHAIKSEEEAPTRLLLSLLKIEVFSGGITLSTLQYADRLALSRRSMLGV